MIFLGCFFLAGWTDHATDSMTLLMTMTYTPEGPKTHRQAAERHYYYY